MTQQVPAHGAPLHGVTVLDLTTFLSGPFGTQILADLGARVIKLEPLHGDSSRSIPPHFVGEDSAYYLGNNRNKESVALDLKSERGRALALDLVAQSDVVIENFRPGVAARLGLDAAALRRRHPRLVWASISGFGQDGPWRDRVAYDMIVQALSGVMSLTGEPGQPSVRLGIPAGDLVAGLFATVAITSALYARQNSGEGRTIDVSMLEGQLAMLSYQAVYAMLSGTAPQPQGSAHDSIPTYRSFTAGDGRRLVVTANTERMWVALCEALDRPELPQDPRFADAGARLAHREALWEVLEAAFLARDAAAWVAELTARSVPAALIQTVPEALRDAADSGRGMVLDLRAPDGRAVRALNTPITFPESAPREHSYPPRLGEQSRAVLTDLLGLPDDEVDRLHRDGVLGMPTAEEDGHRAAAG